MKAITRTGMPVAIAALLAVPTAFAGTYQLHVAKTNLVVRTYIGGVASSIGHGHVSEATRFKGDVRYDPEDAEANSISFEIDARSLKADRNRSHICVVSGFVLLPGSLSSNLEICFECS